MDIISYNFLGMPLWLFIFTVYFSIYTFYKACKLYSQSYVKVKDEPRFVMSLEHGLKNTYFENRTHFLLYDVFRVPFILPSALLGTFFLLFKEGAWRLFPFIRKIFGFKLFKIELKEEIDKDKD